MNTKENTKQIAIEFAFEVAALFSLVALFLAVLYSQRAVWALITGGN